MTSHTRPQRIDRSTAPATLLLRTVVFCAILFVLLAALQRTCHSYGGGQAWWNTYLSEPDGGVDVLFLGSSHAHSTTSPLDLWQEYGFTSFNLTGSSQGLETSYYFLREALKTQKPQVVVLELYMIQGYPMNDQAMASNYGLMPWGENKVRGYLAESDTADDVLNLLFPLLRDHSRWSMLKRPDFAKIWLGPEHPPIGLGHPMDFHIEDATSRVPEAEPAPEVYEESLRTLEKLARVCKDEGIPLVLYFCPQSLPDQDLRLGEIESHLSAEFPDVRYLDMNAHADDMDLDLTTDFTLADGHLNHPGAVKANTFLGEYLVDGYGLVDRRQDPAYQRWNDATAVYNQYVETTRAAYKQP